MPKLNDTQTILLSSASQREDGSIYPLPRTMSTGPRVTKALAGLIKAGFAEERATRDVTLACRREGDDAIGTFVTAAGLAAIGVGEEITPTDTPASTEATGPRISKRDAVIVLLSREGGATIAELIAATGWLPHTTRAALTGLRKQGHDVVRGKRGEQTCYSLAAA
ncbi:DUF3489 domain-containing protein [Sphingomonas sp.]|uniref:DUF3489 domain-containing protein n=1 Tax=Sphingomonas sp. TaxID=28214 RepID=UPI002DD65FBD|nr:DUF3489 domain-containing protein [Sphingomonas sp.]